MSRFRNTLRIPVWALALAVLSLVLATAGVVGWSAIHLPKITTPKSENDITNIDILRSEIKNYYGTSNAATGSGSTAGWTLQLNLASNYAAEARSVAADGTRWLDSQSHHHWWWTPSMKAIVLDVDDTTLTTWNYELYSNWDYNPGTNATFVGLTSGVFTGNMFPATPGMVDMVNRAASHGYAVFFVTGRGDSQHAATIANLVNDIAAGYPETTTTGFGNLVPEIDASFVAPTPVDIGHGGFTDGLFTKPPVGSYPSYLNKPEFCADAIAASVSCPTIQYKSGTRAYIESLGYDIVADFGDQCSDLQGGFADKIFKMPNPNYYLP